MPNTAPALTGLAAAATFLENTVNATPQIIDADVTFTDTEGNFNGGRLTVSGLLAEDTVSVQNQGAGTGQIGFAAGTVSYEGTAIGTLTGGAGGTLTVTFNAAATTAAIDALLQTLTYANSSNTPTASRTLKVNVVDAAGAGTLSGPAGFTELIGAANPANGLDVGSFSTPTLGDLDGDGDLDLAVGDSDGRLLQSINTGGTFGALTQVGTVNAGGNSTPTLGDLDGDGDLDLVAGGGYDGTLFSSINTGGTFGALAQIGTFGVGANSEPTLGDLDGDGDLDLVVGNDAGLLYQSVNTGGTFGALTQIGSLDVGALSTPALGDLDGDGDLDLVVGEFYGKLYQSINTGGTFGALTQIGTFNVGYRSNPTLGDIDGDGDLDLVVGKHGGTLTTFLNTSAGFAITINVTAEAEPPVAENDAFSTGETTPVTSGNLFSNNGSGADSGSPLTITHINGAAFSSGSQITLASGALLTVNADGTFSYDPNGAFMHLGAAGSGAIAADLQATDSFTYTLTGGDQATVTFTITGVDNNDVLHGQSVNDPLTPVNGGAGNDKLYAHATSGSILNGEADNDVLVAGAGGDAMTGGLGIDWASYEDSGAVQINIGTPAANTGDALSDTYTSIERFLLSDFGDVFVGGSAAEVIWGGDGVDTLNGGAGNDTLNGGAGADTMAGGADNDIYFVDDLSDVVTELSGGGNDRVSSTVSLTGAHALAAEVEEGRLIGAALGIDGNAINNRLLGNALANRLNGAAGIDTLTGNAGADTFILQKTAANRDLITDFASVDLLEISAASFGAGLAAGALGAAQFEANAAGLATAATTRFVYDTDGGQLWFDTNGSTAGGRQLIANLTNLAALTEADFIIV